MWWANVARLQKIETWENMCKHMKTFEDTSYLLTEGILLEHSSTVHRSLVEMDIFFSCGAEIARLWWGVISRNRNLAAFTFEAIYIMRCVHCHPPMYQVTQVRDSQQLSLSKNQTVLMVPSACLLCVYYRGSAPGYALTARLHLCSPERTCKQN